MLTLLPPSFYMPQESPLQDDGAELAPLADDAAALAPAVDDGESQAPAADDREGPDYTGPQGDGQPPPAYVRPHLATRHR